MLSRLARAILRICGWTAVGGVPAVHKAVVIAAPHTSNWDAFWALTYKVAVGLDVKFFAKRSLFWFPLGAVLKSLGAIPLDRSAAGSAVNQAIALLEGPGRCYFGLAPEGTRSKMAAWKTGFYRIAEGAAVPIYLGFLDYGSRRLGIGPMLTPTGDIRADIDICRQFYASVEGRWPDKTCPVVIPDDADR